MNEKPQTIRLFVFKILHDKQHSCRIKCSMDGFSSFFAILMLCAGLFLSVRINFFQFTHLGCAIKTALGLGQRRAAENVRRKQKSDASGVTPFQALSSALGGSIGTANIAGVASAIAIGGAGAVFYMWLAALVGMGVKFCEIVLALRYREKRGGQWCGGAMLYIEKGFRKSNTGSRFLQSVSKPLAAGFALFGLLASSVGTPLVQSNTIAMSVNDAVLLFLPKAEQKTVCIIAGAVTAALVGIVILGGIQRTFHGDRLYCNLHHSSEQVRRPHTSCILRYFQRRFGHKAGSRRRGGLRCGACAADRHGARSVFKRSGGRLRSDGSCLRKHERSRKAGNVRNF